MSDDYGSLKAEAVARAKNEVLDLIASGDVPEGVSSFADLHDFVDANGLGGLCDDEFLARVEAAGVILPDDGRGVASDEFIAFGDDVQGAVDAWLKDGRPGDGACPRCSRWHVDPAGRAACSMREDL